MFAVYVRKAGRRDVIIVGRNTLFSGRVLQDTLRSVALVLFAIWSLARYVYVCCIIYIMYDLGQLRRLRLRGLRSTKRDREECVS